MTFGGFQYDLGQKYNAPQVRPDRGLNSWPPDHASTFHVTKMPAVTTQPPVKSELQYQGWELSPKNACTITPPVPLLVTSKALVMFLENWRILLKENGRLWMTHLGLTVERGVGMYENFTSVLQQFHCPYGSGNVLTMGIEWADSQGIIQIYAVLLITGEWKSFKKSFKFMEFC